MKVDILFLEDHKSRRFLKGETHSIPEESLEAWLKTGIVEQVSAEKKAEKKVEEQETGKE